MTSGGCGETDWGTMLSPGTVRRLACDARIVPLVLGGASEPLDVGRASYAVPAPMRRALQARDGGCAFPGCDRPPGWCHAQHIQHWADGGATVLGNLVLLCGHHHRFIHGSGWQVTMGESGHPEFRPPPWLKKAHIPRPTPSWTRLPELATQALSPPSRQVA